MRNIAILMTATTLAACSGGGAQSVSSTATSAGTGTPAPTTTSGSGTSVDYTQLVTPTTAKTYSGIGGNQVYEYLTDNRNCCNQQAQIFAANTSTVRSSGASIAYDPANAVFTLTVTDPNTNAATTTRFQDPAARTNFGGSVTPQWGVPNLNDPNFRYLEAGDGSPISPYKYSGTGAVNIGDNTNAPNGLTGSTYQSTDLFYEVPGTSTKYVSLAGYLRNSLSWSDVGLVDGSNNPVIDPVTGKQIQVHNARWHLERGAFAYGIQTAQSAVPTTGSGTYTGSMLASLVYNPTIDGAYGAKLPTYFQWIQGTSTTTVNFASGAVGLSLAGTVGAPFYDYYTGPTATSIAAGTSFTATGTATINLVNTGGYKGSFGSASFGSTTNGSPTALNIAGSTIDGAFFGPAAEETGGGFHIVGGTPDQRIDIVGAFKGKKP